MNGCNAGRCSTRTSLRGESRWFEDGREQSRGLAEERTQPVGFGRSIIRGEGASEAAIELLQESTERFLKAYLIARGWPLRKVHDLGSLLAEAEKHDPRLGVFADFADELTDQFWAMHYPGGELDDAPPDYAALREQLARLLEILAAR